MDINTLLQHHRKRIQEGKLRGCNWTTDRWSIKLMEELGEFAECLNKPDDITLSKEEELADLIHTTLCLAISMGINDIETLLRSKFNEVSLRKGSSIMISEQ